MRWILVVATVTIALAGCYDGAMSTEAYFSDLETIAQKTDDAVAAWQERTRDALTGVTSAQEASEVMRLLLEDGLEIFQTALDELEDLLPPDEVADEHAAFTDSYRDMLHAYQILFEDYDTLGFEGVVAAIQRQDLQSLDRASQEACADLQNSAEDGGVDVDLKCED